VLIFSVKLSEEKQERERQEMNLKKLSKSKRAKLKKQQKVINSDNTARHRKLLYRLILDRKKNVTGGFDFTQAHSKSVTSGLDITYTQS